MAERPNHCGEKQGLRTSCRPSGRVLLFRKMATQVEKVLHLEGSSSQPMLGRLSPADQVQMQKMNGDPFTHPRLIASEGISQNYTHTLRELSPKHLCQPLSRLQVCPDLCFASNKIGASCAHAYRVPDQTIQVARAERMRDIHIQIHNHV